MIQKDKAKVYDKLMEFIETANETTGCSFTLTRNKNYQYTIYLPNLNKQFSHNSLSIVLDNAIKYIKKIRVVIHQVPIRYVIK